MIIIFWFSLNCIVKIKKTVDPCYLPYVCFCYFLYGQNVTEKYVAIIFIKAIITFM